MFFSHAVNDLCHPQRRFLLSLSDIALLNPNTRTCPIFRSRKDAELTKAIYRRVPVLIREARGGQPEENPWGIRFRQGLFNMTSDSHLFRTREALESEGWRLEGNVFRKGREAHLPLYEGRFGHQFNHRFASQPACNLREHSFTELCDANQQVEPQYWVGETEVQAQLSRRESASKSCLLGFRRVARDTDERTSIASILPWGAASYGWILSFGPMANELSVLCSNYNTLQFDYLLRGSLSQPSIPQCVNR